MLKKIIVLLFSFVILSSIAIAEQTDFSSYEKIQEKYPTMFRYIRNGNSKYIIFFVGNQEKKISSIFLGYVLNVSTNSLAIVSYVQYQGTFDFIIRVGIDKHFSEGFYSGDFAIKEEVLTSENSQTYFTKWSSNIKTIIRTFPNLREFGKSKKLEELFEKMRMKKNDAYFNKRIV